MNAADAKLVTFNEEPDHYVLVTDTKRARRTRQERAEIKREYLRLVAPKDVRTDLSYDDMETIVSMIQLNRVMSGQLAND